MSETKDKSGKKSKKTARSARNKSWISLHGKTTIKGHKHAHKLSPTNKRDRLLAQLTSVDVLDKKLVEFEQSLVTESDDSKRQSLIAKRTNAERYLLLAKREIKRLDAQGVTVCRYRIPKYPSYECIGKGARVRTMYAVEQDGWDNIEGHKVAHYDEFLFCPTKATWQDISSTEEALVFVDAPEARRSMIEQTREWVKASPHAPQQLTVITRVDNRIALRTASLRGIVAIAPVGEKEVSE